MSSCECFEFMLHYATSAHSGWGVVRTGMLASENYQPFICPSAYGRHGALGALKQGLKDRISYYYVDQSDIINGYDDLTLSAVEELLRALKKRPRVMFVFVSRLDDLIGTDCDVAETELELRRSDIKFRMAHINPITLSSDEPPPIGIQKRTHSLLSKQLERDGGVNNIGNLVTADPEYELHKMLAQEGVFGPCYVSQYQNFDKWQEMAKSPANLVLMPPGTKVAKEMKVHRGVPYRFFPVSYDLDMAIERYRGTREFSCPNTSVAYDPTTDRQAAEKVAEHTVKKLGKLPLILDSSAVVCPLSLVKAPGKYGLTAHRIFAQGVTPSDREALEWVTKHIPTVEILQLKHNDIVKFDRHFPDNLSIGVNAAYISGPEHVVDLFADEGLFGYCSIRRLMELMEEVADTVIDLYVLIEDYGLVV